MGILGRIFKKEAAPKRVFLMGLDGTPWGLFQMLCSQGVFKNFARIAAQGSFLKMSTTVPDVSSVAWTTFMTGVNPGRHGVFGFVDLKPGSYNTYFPNSTHVRSPTLWQYLGKEGRRSVVINMPSTYPAQEINGSLIAGFVAIDLEKATYPKSLVPWLRQIGYRLDVDAGLARQNPDRFFEELHISLEKGQEVFLRLMREEQWDFFAAVVTGTDRLHHFFWDAWEDASSPYHCRFLEYYGKVDELAGKLYEALDGRAVFLALSDHGFGRLRRDVYLNRWLEENGYLAFSGPKRDSVADMDPARTRAFCLDPGRIYVNLKRRFPQGLVLPGREYEQLLDELTSRLASLCYETGPGKSEKVLRRVFHKAELFRGPFESAAPDLVLLANPGSNLKGATTRTQIFDTDGPFTGMHTQDDAFFLSDRPAADPGDMHILDASHTVMAVLGSRFLSSVEGKMVLAD